MPLEDHLPPDLRGPATTITRIANGLSGAAVYRVEAAGQSFVLKIAAERESGGEWRRSLDIERLAAGAGLAPRVVYADEASRTVLTAFVEDRSFMVFYRSPQSHEAALAQLARTVRRIHALPLPDGAPERDPRELLAQVGGGLLSGFALPGFAAGAIQRVLAGDPPPRERAPVLGHNDLNPSNFIYDGEAILVLDWSTAGRMDPFYDLAVLALFLRMDEGTCLLLLSAYDERPAAALPDRFRYARRLAGALVGSISLHLARQLKHPGATGAETPETTLSLGDFYQQMRAGALKLGTPDGQWAFGLALLKESLAA
ncbi:aminoglycoside phosphotransferase [Minicystis rosea]|nr:aminoglycoside phosphotransferase [Minicystis rosea]